ncbi:MAG: hypothetical protein K8H88_08525 [Sandaracinaceae bacterium]|nr:hypothetical protein [Sandaracinaceae bacterium]
MIQLEAVLPVVTRLGTTTQLMTSFAATLAGPPPYGGGIPVRVAAIAEASMTTSGERPSFAITRFTALAVSMPPGFEGEDRTNVRGFGAILAHHVLGFATGQAMPSVPIASMTAPASITLGGMAVSTGIAPGTQLGIASPMITFQGDQFEAVGDLTAL